MNSPIALAAAAALASASPTTTPLPGIWKHHGTEQELVVQPRVKLQPYVVPGYGTTLGGSVGYGSATATTIVTEAQPMKVARDMTLSLEDDGKFSWLTVKRHTDGSGCIRTTELDRQGRYQGVADGLRFEIAGGSEVTTSTCGGTSRSKLPASVETYQLGLRGGALTLSSGGATWMFQRP